MFVARAFGAASGAGRPATVQLPVTSFAWTGRVRSYSIEASKASGNPVGSCRRNRGQASDLPIL